MASLNMYITILRYYFIQSGWRFQDFYSRPGASPVLPISLSSNTEGMEATLHMETTISLGAGCMDQ